MAPNIKCRHCGEHRLAWAFIGDKCQYCVKAESTQLRSDLAAVTQERDELKADAVRFNIHLEQKDRAIAANAKYCEELKANHPERVYLLRAEAAEKERDTLRAEKLLILQQVNEYDTLIRDALQLPNETEWRVEFYAQEIRRLVGEAEEANEAAIRMESALADASEEFRVQLATERAQGRELFKKVAVDFFYWWHNSPGSNTEQGFDEWWASRAEVSTLPAPKCEGIKEEREVTFEDGWLERQAEKARKEITSWGPTKREVMMREFSTAPNWNSSTPPHTYEQGRVCGFNPADLVEPDPAQMALIEELVKGVEVGRTYEQGAVDMRERAAAVAEGIVCGPASFNVEWNDACEQIEKAIRALPEKEDQC